MDGDGDIRECSAETVFLLTPTPAAGFSTHRESRFRVTFSFRYRSNIVNWITNSDSSRAGVLSEHILPSTTSSVELSLDKFMNRREACQIMSDNLSLPLRERLRIIDFAITTARKLVKHMPLGHNVLNLRFMVTAFHHRLVSEDEALDLTMRESMEEARLGMVPALDSSIESLERVIVDSSNGDCCTVCMEELVISECVKMPCSHVFHEGCINKWLRTSRYCPLCRFEMPA